MSYLVEELLNFFEQREGERISSEEIEKVMDKAAERIEELEARVKELEGNIIATDKEYPAYGCHVDLFEIKDMKPDECVIDLGRPQDCIYAKGRTDKTTCEYWKPCS